MSSDPLDLYLSGQTEERQRPAPGDPLDDYLVGRQPAVQQDGPPSVMERVARLVTGSDRQTRATHDLPSLADVGVDGFLGSDSIKNLPTAALLTTTYDAQEARDILSNASGKDVGLTYDEEGNAMLSLGNQRVLFNPPGFDKTDAMQLGAGAAMFTPAGRAGLGVSALKAIGRVGAVSAGTQALAEGAQSTAGGSFDSGDVAVTGALGSAGQGIGAALVRAMPSLREVIRDHGVTDSVRSLVRETAVRLGFKPEEITDQVVASMVADAKGAVNPQEVIGVAGSQEFGIPLMRGQRSMDQAALSAEDSMRVGLQGRGAQDVVRNFETQQQRPAIDAAAERLQGSLRGSPIGSPRQAGANVIEAIRGAEDAMNTAVQLAYADVGDATLTADGMRGLLKATRNAVRGVEFDQSLKGTKFLLNGTKDLERVLNVFRPGQIRPVQMERVEQWRRRINSAFDAAENPTDKRQVMTIKLAFDGYLDSALADGLIKGDKNALLKFRNARDLMRDYANLFYPLKSQTRGGTRISDRSGDLIQRIIYSNPTDEEVVNSILGGASMTAKGGKQMAERFKRVLGPDSEEWGQVRQAAFRRLIQTSRENGQEVISADKSLSAFNRALEKNGSLVDAIFTPEEVSTIRRYLLTVKRTQPDIVRSRENPSGTTQKAGKAMVDLARRVGAIFGVAGDPTMLLSSAGVEAAAGFRSATQARNAVRPFQPIISGRTGTELIPALTASGGAQARE